jgi:hypothetical protein
MTELRSTSFVRWLRVARSAFLVEAGLRLRPLDELLEALGIGIADGQPAQGDQAPSPSISAQVGWAFHATDRVLAVLPGQARCLRRALIAGHLLREHKPSLRIGSLKRDGRLTFHAWLELDGRVAADPEAPSFRRLVRVRPVS